MRLEVVDNSPSNKDATFDGIIYDNDTVMTIKDGENRVTLRNAEQGYCLFLSWASQPKDIREVMEWKFVAAQLQTARIVGFPTFPQEYFQHFHVNTANRIKKFASAEKEASCMIITDKVGDGGHPANEGPGDQGFVDIQTVDPLVAYHRDCKPLLQDASSRTALEMETGIQALVRFGSTVNWDVVRRKLREEPTTDELARTKRYLALLIPLYDQLMAARGLPSAPVGDIVFDGDGWRRIIAECEEVLLDGSTRTSLSCPSCSSSSSGGGTSKCSSSSSAPSVSSMPSPSSVSFLPPSTVSTKRVQAEMRIRVKPELGIFYHGEDMTWGVPVPICGFPPRITFMQEGTVTDGFITLPLGPGTSGESVLLEIFVREDLLGSFSGAVISADGWLSYGAFQTVRVGPGTLGERRLLLMRDQSRKYGPYVGSAARPSVMGQVPGPVQGKFGSCGFNANEIPQFTCTFQGEIPSVFQNRPNGSNEASNTGRPFTPQPDRVEDVEMGGMNDMTAASCASNANSIFHAPFLQRGLGNHNVIQPQQRVNVFYGCVGGGAGGHTHVKDRLVALLDEILESCGSNETPAADTESERESEESEESEKSEEDEESEPMDVDEPEEHRHGKNRLWVAVRSRIGGRKRQDRCAEDKDVDKPRKRIKRRGRR
ncbi:hypothetical protein ACRALDRAFT_1095222 [Sodiomyces alcalophilus JCM 7366]|uniref:uncharacterized protein n=1 Tax=Sodiomyces alcalophilus JCM 7366 TaxID=591952 RepID=UPI0039B3DD75